MLSDLLLALVLLVLLRMLGGRVLPAAPGGERSPLSLSGLRTAWADPQARLLALAVGLAITGWAFTLALADPDQIGGMMEGQPVSDRATDQRCYQAQRRITSEMRITLDPGEPLPANPLPNPYQVCPLGGTLSLDAQARVTCSLHGQPADALPIREQAR